MSAVFLLNAPRYVGWPPAALGRWGRRQFLVAMAPPGGYY
jgi:hypothetical protein